MTKHSPLPWTLVELEGGDHIIKDANGGTVHHDTSYYPSGMATEDARLIVRSVNAQALWKPIETVPDDWKDGKREIVALAPEWDHGQRPIILRWFKYNGLEAWRDWDGDALDPTHWHPLAALPNTPTNT